MFGLNKKPAKRKGESSGPLTEKDLAHVHELLDEVGTQKERGFIIVVKRKTVEKDDDHEAVEIDGTIKASNVNRKFILDTVVHGLHMDNKDLMEYVMARTVMGGDYDEAEDVKRK